MADHHPNPELLAAYTAGSLPLSHALSVAAHVERCSICQLNVQRLNNLGAQMMESTEPSTVSDELRNNVFAMLDDQPEVEDVPEAPAPKANNNVPKCLQQFVPDGYDALKWSKVSSSIETAMLCTDSNGARVEMVRIKPGGQIATHTHTGDEFTLVLEGSFSDESGIYQSGDFVLRDSSHEHKPIATKDSACICLTVTDAPIAFTGFFTRMLNPLLKRSHSNLSL